MFTPKTHTNTRDGKMLLVLIECDPTLTDNVSDREEAQPHIYSCHLQNTHTEIAKMLLAHAFTNNVSAREREVTIPAPQLFPTHTYTLAVH